MKVKNRFALGGVAFLVLAIGLLSGNCFAADAARSTVSASTPDLKEVVKWGVWHEGCRAFSADDSIADADQLRECLVSAYANNAYLQQRLRAANKQLMQDAVRSAVAEIPSERQIESFVEFACNSRGLFDKFKQMADAADFDGMRSLYFNTFKSSAEVRNLLAAVSNNQLRTIINEFDLANQVRQMNANLDEPHVPMAQAD